MLDGELDMAVGNIGASTLPCNKYPSSTDEIETIKKPISISDNVKAL